MSMQKNNSAFVGICVFSEPIHGGLHAHMRFQYPALIHESAGFRFLRNAPLYVLLGVVALDHVQIQIRGGDGDVVGIGGIHSGAVVLAAGHLHDPSHIRNVVDQMERADFQIQTIHPVTDFSGRIFGPDKNNSVKRHLRPCVQIRQHIDTAYEPHQGSAVTELIKGVNFEMISVNVGQKNKADFLCVGLQPVPRNATVEKEAAVQKNGIANLTTRGNDLTGH